MSPEATQARMLRYKGKGAKGAEHDRDKGRLRTSFWNVRKK